MSDWPGWASDVLKDIPAPVTPSNVRFLDEWHPYEESSCTYNPLNTTLPWTKSRKCVHVGSGSLWVQAYTTSIYGAKATAATFNNGYYPNIVAALKQGNPYTYIASQAVAAEIRRWGTPLYADFYLTQVGVSGPGAPPPAPTGGGDGGGTTTAGGVAPKGMNGFNDLRRSVAGRIPTALKTAQRFNVATSRALVARRKVGGR